jgi:hypothetical protein
LDSVKKTAQRNLNDPRDLHIRVLLEYNEGDGASHLVFRKDFIRPHPIIDLCDCDDSTHHGLIGLVDELVQPETD